MLKQVLYVLLAFVGLISTVPSVTRAEEAESPIEVFNRRIMPIFRSEKPSSCVQCHLAGVDLKNYIADSHEKTFVSLRDQGLIDLDAPEKSKVLTLIEMGRKDLDEGARLIHEATRQAEYDAFAAWIKASAADPALRSLPRVSEDEQARPARPDGVIRHARKSRVVDAFVRNVWSQRMRCFPCHTPHEIDADNPQQQAAVKTRRQLIERYGEEFMQNRLSFFRETPEATLQHLIERSRETAAGELPLLNLADPANSLLLLKPMSKLPAKNEAGEFEPVSSKPPITHMGGLKLHKNDQSYKAIVAWLQDYANVVGNRYASVEDLPADNWVASQFVLRITEAPAEWKEGDVVQMFVHQFDEDAGEFSTKPIAFTQGTVNPRRAVVGALLLFAEQEVKPYERAVEPKPELPRAEYLVRAYVDKAGKVAKDPTLLLDEADFFGQAELGRIRWREGFPRAESISGGKLVKP